MPATRLGRRSGGPPGKEAVFKLAIRSKSSQLSRIDLSHELSGHSGGGHAMTRKALCVINDALVDAHVGHAITGYRKRATPPKIESRVSELWIDA